MKPLLEVEKERRAYHASPQQNTVHRASLLAPNLEGARLNICFLNHFLIKRGIDKIICKITAIGPAGQRLGAVTLPVEGARVHSLYPDGLFPAQVRAGNYLVEFYTAENLFFPFPAVMINHIGPAFCNVVHAYNRVLNDVFEDDAVNRQQVKEASIDVNCVAPYDAFIDFFSGIEAFDGTLGLEYVDADGRVDIALPVQAPRLTHKRLSLTDAAPQLRGRSGGVLKVEQPRQTLFYGRLLAGTVDRSSGAFSANHSYYDTSETEEYFDAPSSARTYPFFSKFSNQIKLYPIISPGRYQVRLQAEGDRGAFLSDPIAFESPSHTPVSIDVGAALAAADIGPCNAFTVRVEDPAGQRVPTRISHQLIYGDPRGRSALTASISVGLINPKLFTPEGKTGQAWGQAMVSQDYDSLIGVCFAAPDGAVETVQLTFYTEAGRKTTFDRLCVPGQALIIDAAEILRPTADIQSLWFVVKSRRADLGVYAAHVHRSTGHASGEHGF